MFPLHFRQAPKSWGWKTTTMSTSLVWSISKMQPFSLQPERGRARGHGWRKTNQERFPSCFHLHAVLLRLQEKGCCLRSMNFMTTSFVSKRWILQNCVSLVILSISCWKAWQPGWYNPYSLWAAPQCHGHLCLRCKRQDDAVQVKNEASEEE